MAKIQPIHGQMSGSIAGNTWSRNRGGQYVRQRRKPVNPNTQKQQRVRTNLGSISSQWAALTAAQRAAWRDWAQMNPTLDTLGQPIILSGQQLFNGLNARLMDAIAAIKQDPPPGVGPIGLMSLSISVTGAAATITFAPTPTGANNRLVIRWTGWHSKGTDPNINQTRVAGYSPVNAASPLSFSLPSAGVVGQATNIYIAVMNANGQLSAFQKARVEL